MLISYRFFGPIDSIMLTFRSSRTSFKSHEGFIKFSFDLNYICSYL